MNIEEKARAYDKAIEKIKYVMEHGVSPVLNKEDLQDIFPELKESEDERIRKWLIGYLENRCLNTPIGIEKENCGKAITWLEKQGNPADKTDVVDTPPFKASDWYVSKVDGKIHDMTHSPNNEDKQTNVEESTMTIEQERLFEKNVWDYHITENTAEYEIAKYFFVLGLKARGE